MLLRTPNARDGEPRGTQSPEKRLAGGHQPSLGDQIEHMVTLPTPTSRDWKDGPPCANVPENALLGRVVHNLTPTPDQQRILDHVEVEPESGCWMWTSWTNQAAIPYGRVSVNGQKVYAHRASYEAFVGPIPDGHEIDHLCQTSLCVNPSHLEAVSSEENRDRVAQRRTHCKRGHEFTEENTYWVREGARACRACRAWQDKVQKARRKGEEPPPEPLLPTPCANDMGAAYTPDQWDAWTARMKAEHNNGNGHGPSLNIEAQRVSLLPTTTMDAHGSGGNPDTTGTHGTTLTDATVRQPSRWGKYAAAIARWEAITRPAPEPTNITDGYLKARAKRLARLDRRPVGMRGSLKVRRQLAAKFSEWMMGVPLGWITGVPGITRNEALKAAGNGVVPQQAAEALRFLLDMPTGRQIAEAHEPDDLLELLAVTQ